MKQTKVKNFINVDDDENNDETSIEVTKRSKKTTKSSKSIKSAKTKNSRHSKETTVTSTPDYKEQKDEDITYVESVLGDFHNLSDLNKFKNMTHLSLISQNINNIELIIQNIPVKENIVFLCLNENEISNLNSLELLINLKELHLNFNFISTITGNLKTLQYITKLWICENQITSIQNLPPNIEELWLAMNNITSIPSEISQYDKITFFNIAGNLITDLEDLYHLQRLPFLKKLYFIDVNFGDNPLCQYVYYRYFILHFFPNLTVLDQVVISAEEKREASNLYSKKYLFNKNKIRQNHKISKMIFQLLKTNKLFLTTMKLNQACFFSQRQKMLEYAKYEKEILKIENDTKIEEIEKEISASTQRLNYCLNIISSFEMYFKFLKKYISEINNLSIVATFYEIETWGNCKIEPGNMNLKWTKSCMDVMKSRIPESFYEKNKIKSIRFNKIFKIINKKSKLLFDSVYSGLIDKNKKFGEDKNYFDFYFLLFPKHKENYINIISSVFEEEGEIPNEMILTNCLYQIDEKIYQQDKTSKFFAILCKCANFDSIMEKSNINSFVDLNDYDSIKYELNKITTTKEVIQITQEHKKYFLYKLTQVAIPEYILEYEYESLPQEQQSSQMGVDNYFVSSFTTNLSIHNEYEQNFNTCAKYLYGNDNQQFLHEELINKYSYVKFGEFNELESSVLFLAKNSILTYLNKCFKYQNIGEYKNDFAKIKDKLKEISNLKFQRFFKDVIVKKELKEKVNINSIKEINLFNRNLNDATLKEFLQELKNISNIDENEDIKNMLNNITKIVLCKNKITSIDISDLINLFPNLLYIDLSHNNIKNLSIGNTELENKIEIIDLTFNNIFNFNIISLLINALPVLKVITIYGNPLPKIYYSNLLSNPDDLKVTPDLKEKINNLTNISKENICSLPNSSSFHNNNNNVGIKNFDILFDCYSLGDSYQYFSSSKYFRETVNKESNYKSLILSKRKLINVPLIDSSQRDIQLLYINLNKITQIENLNQFTNLVELYIQNNKISKLTNLPNTLIKLDISNNDLHTIEGIEQAHKLKWLNIENNAIKSIKEIVKLKNLTELYSAGNFIHNEKECYSLKVLNCLEIVDISGNDICRNVHDIRLGMIFYCQKLKQFNRITIDENERVKAKEYFTGKLTSEILEKKLGSQYNTLLLRELDLSFLKLKDEAGMFNKETYPQLVKLNLSKNLFKSFNIFGFLPSLIELNMNYNLLTAITIKNDKKVGKGIIGLPNLESLELSGNTISNLNGIQVLQNLKILVLRENNINKIDAITKMGNLTFLDLSCNKLRNIERTQIGYLPNLQILLCDNNFLKTINAFSKLEALQTISFENNKIMDILSLEKLSNLYNLKDLNLQNNPITKTVSYRSKMLKLFERLLKLDNTEITSEEREMILLEMQMGDYFDESITTMNGGLLNSTNKNYSFNIQKQDKNLKRVNFVQLDLLHNNTYMLPGTTGRIVSPNNMISLPHIKPYPFGFGIPVKPPSSDSKKRVSHAQSNSSCNNMINNNHVNLNGRGNSSGPGLRPIPINYILNGGVNTGLNARRNGNNKDLFAFMGNNNTFGTDVIGKSGNLTHQKTNKKK